MINMIIGIEIDRTTNKVKQVELNYEIKTNSDGEKSFQLIGGPTGYESFYIDKETAKRKIKYGWKACMGTKNSWNKLFIPAEEMNKIKELHEAIES